MTADKPNFVSRILSPAGLAMLGIGAIVAYYAFTEHTAHVFSLLPFGVLLLCPLMHLFMMGGHGHHDSGPNEAQSPAPAPKAVERAEGR